MCPLVTLSATLFSRSFSTCIPCIAAPQTPPSCTYKSVTCISSAADVVTLNWPHLKQIIKGVRTGWLTTGETGVCLGEHTVPVRRFTPDLQNDFWKCFVQFKFDQHDIDNLELTTLGLVEHHHSAGSWDWDLPIRVWCTPVRSGKLSFLGPRGPLGLPSLVS